MQENTGTITREQKYLKLVDEFYQQNKNVVSEEDYQRAKTDPAQFKALIRRVTNLYQTIGRELLLMDKNCKA
jgi:pyoverdine/dityrosine biosynthesis protein Dit1